MPTRAPRAPNSVAIAWPIPDPPPVTMTVRWANVRGSRDSAMDRDGYAVDARRVVGEERAPVRVGPIRRHRVDDRPPAIRTAAERGHWPIGAVEQARCAEALARAANPA